MQSPKKKGGILPFKRKKERTSIFHKNGKIPHPSLLRITVAIFKSSFILLHRQGFEGWDERNFYREGESSCSKASLYFHIISSMENLRTYEKKVFDLRQLLEISRALNSTLDYYYLIQAVLDMCLAQAQTLKAGLFLTPNMDSETLLPVSISKDFELPPSKSKFYQIDTNAEFINFLKNEKEHTLSMQKMLELFPQDSHIKIFQRLGVELVIGMVTRGAVLGIIFLGEKITGESYSPDECSFLSDLASLSGIAVTNARLYDRATIDQMTGLKNHAYFQSALRQECDKARKRHSNLAILFTDVDHFKSFNDTHGHQAGDNVLKSVAKVLKDCTRKNDLAARLRW